MSRDFGHREFSYPEPCIGYITSVLPLDPMTRRLYALVRPLDNRQGEIKAMVLTPPGFTANVRKGMTVRVDYINGNPQSPVITMHTYNTEDPKSDYGDPLPTHHAMIDDVSIHHDGVSAFMRFRNIKSTASAFGKDGSPGRLDLGFRSGMMLSFVEADPPASSDPNAPPPKPQAAQVLLTMPNGLTLNIDEQGQGSNTTEVLLSHPSGAKIEVNPSGDVTIVTSKKIAVASPDVEIGQVSADTDPKTGASLGTSSFKGKTVAFHDELKALETYLSTHTHTNVQTGTSPSGPPSTAPPASVGTKDTKAS